MDAQTLHLIAKQQTERFFYSYNPDWRLTQILMIEKLLADRYNFFDDILNKSSDRGRSASKEAIICQEVTNGLFFEAMATAIQSIEDTFALLHAAQSKLRFISNIINYPAGKVANLIKSKHTAKSVASLFYVPFFENPIEPEAAQIAYQEGMSLLLTMVHDLQDFYKKYKFFYNQYKHGLCVVFRAYVDFTEEMVVNHKAATPEPVLIQVFDSQCITKIEKDDIRVNRKIMMPFLTPEIQSNLPQLMKEDNLIRFVLPDERLYFSDLVDVVKKARACSGVLHHNLVRAFVNEYPLRIKLPEENWLYTEFTFPEEDFTGCGNLHLF